MEIESAEPMENTMRVPTTARDQLLFAHELGHDLSVEAAASREDYAASDGGERFRLLCTCGWRSHWRGSRRALNSRMGLHLGKVIGEALADGTPDDRGTVVPLRGGPGEPAQASTVSELEQRAK